ncbi:MAG: hypothetical protein K2G42_03720 [Clostridia bacterium]|nr:hypothetical protein [Clostridia bacterium]
MGLFSNLFKKKPAKKSSEELIAEYLQSKSLNGEKFNAKDYFAKDVLSNTADVKLIAALKSALGTNEVEPCGESVHNDWEVDFKYVNICIMINEFNDDGVMVVLGVENEVDKIDSVDIWVGVVDEPTVSINLDKCPDGATDASFIYQNAAQKVKDYLSSKGLIK